MEPVFVLVVVQLSRTFRDDQHRLLALQDRQRFSDAGRFHPQRVCCPGAALELLPYHRYGETKYDALGLPRPPAAFGTPTKAQLSGWEQLAAQEYGIKVISYK